MKGLLILVLLAGCLPFGKEKTEAKMQTSSAFPRSQALGVFGTLSNKVLVPHCVRCHGWARDEQQLLQKVRGQLPLESPFYKRVADGSMPKDARPLGNDEMKIIRDYIMTVPGQEQIPLAGTYQSLRVHLFQKSCLMCHGTQNNQALPILETYEDVRANIDSVQMQLDLENMPPRDHPEIPIPSSEVLKYLQTWVEKDFPIQ